MPTLARRLFLIGVLAALAAVPTYCICSGPSSYCEKLPDRDDRNSAVFVGEVLKATADRVRFTVIEPLLNVKSGDDFMAQLTSDMYIDGMPSGLPSFKAGTRWLVEAKRGSSDQPWTTGVCTRTKTLDHAADDLQILRHWAADEPLAARVSGEIWDPKLRKNISGISVRLSGGNRTLTTLSDAKGHFAFEDLVPGAYQLEAILPSGTVTQAVDLSHAWCAYRVIWPR